MLFEGAHASRDPQVAAGAGGRSSGRLRPAGRDRPGHLRQVQFRSRLSLTGKKLHTRGKKRCGKKEKEDQRKDLRTLQGL